MTETITVKRLFSLNRDEVSRFLGCIYEHSPWVSEALLKTTDPNSINTVTELAAAMKAIVDESTTEQKMTLLCAHPDLCEKVAKMKELTKESQEEQSRAGLQSLEGDELEKFNSLNSNYRAKFNFPFILAVRNATKFTVMSALEGRLPNPPEREIVGALEQVHKIAWMRLLTKVESNDPVGFLTCHVLDTANGCPGKFHSVIYRFFCLALSSIVVAAAKMRIHLTRISPPASAGLIGEYITNIDGRLEGGPALKGKDFMVGTYEWKFFAGDYFASKGTFISGTPFLDEIPIRFGIDNPDDHYHVPLLVSPWSFSTYRGS